MTYTLDQQRQRITEALKHTGLTFSLNDLTGGNETYVDLYCSIHNVSWKAKISNILQGNGCKFCGFDRHHLKDLLNNPAQFDSPRKFYWAKLRDRDEKIFWKYGVCKNSFKTRFPTGEMSKDGLILLDYNLQLSNSICALLVEFYILNYPPYNEFRVYKHLVMKNVGGGTECFRRHVIDGVSFETLLRSALADRVRLLEPLYEGDHNAIVDAANNIESWLVGGATN